MGRRKNEIQRNLPFREFQLKFHPGTPGFKDDMMQDLQKNRGLLLGGEKDPCTH